VNANPATAIYKNNSGITICLHVVTTGVRNKVIKNTSSLNKNSTETSMHEATMKKRKVRLLSASPLNCALKGCFVSVLNGVTNSLFFSLKKV
tara:strand:- start:290 stop:565 length:276 start_codon:yes stop_codon:yes gene_type:complete